MLYRFCIGIIGCSLTFVLACGPSATTDSDDPGGGPDGCVGAQCENHCAAGKQTTLSGKVYAPNGVDPIAGALVYVPRQVSEFPSEVQCEVCDQITDDAIVLTSSDVDGSFTLGPIPTAKGQSPGETVQVVAQMGRFRKLVTVEIENPCEANAAEPEQFRLPSRTAGQDSVPNIAVVTGDFDVMECVLLNLGLDEDAFDLYNGIQGIFGPGSPGTLGNVDSLLMDLPKMKQYNVIFINCGGSTFESMLSNPGVRDNLEAYVAAGGRLYVTDWSYDYVEQVEEFSPLIDFGPGMSGDAPEPLNGAAMGDGGIETDAVVSDDHMAQWLAAVEDATGEEIINDQRKVHIEHFLDDWVMQYQVPPNDSTKVWLTGNVRGGGLSGDLPLTTTFDYQQCGRVLYSSYHTLGRQPSLFPVAFPGYCSSQGPAPQERVLMYLIFHMSDCITVE